MSNTMTIELAKSGRSQCRACDSKIGNDEPRIGLSVDTQSGSTCGYFHPKCAIHFAVAEDESSTCAMSGNKIPKDAVMVRVHGDTASEVLFDLEGFLAAATEAMKQEEKPVEQFSLPIEDCDGFSDLGDQNAKEAVRVLGGLFAGAEKSKTGGEEEEAPAKDEAATEEEAPAEEETPAKGEASAEEEAPAEEKAPADEEAPAEEEAQENDASQKRAREEDATEEAESPEKRSKTSENDGGTSGEARDEPKDAPIEEVGDDVDHGEASKHVAWSFGGNTYYGTMKGKETDGSCYAITSNGKEKSLTKGKDNWWFVDEIPN